MTLSDTVLRAQSSESVSGVTFGIPPSHAVVEMLTHMHTDRKLPWSSLLLPSTPFPDVFTDSTNAPWGSALCQALGIP